MKKYTWIGKVGKSLVPSEFYVQILQEPLRKAFGYIILFILLLSLIVGGYNSYNLKESFDKTIAAYDAGVIPTFSLIEGTLEVEGTEIYRIFYFGFPIIIDGQGVLNINDMLAYKNALILAPDRFIIIRDGIPPMVNGYDNFYNPYGTDTSSTIIREAMVISALLAIPVGMIFQFFMSLMDFFFNSLFILMIANLLRTLLGLGLKLKQLYHMTIYAMTFSVFWSHFKIMLPATMPRFLDNFVYYIIPSLILVNVFIHIRKRALDEIDKNKKDD
ncbi:MAG: hypothetical protein CVU98_01335 [Firmicutes bacterium HGW-Firmicutes-3]|jgi:hypothetical protein|nr:MAG: hypothetical protein CVU98_01335 [Firmicutes bacterium HGW-Firmicutes-3]